MTMRIGCKYSCLALCYDLCALNRVTAMYTEDKSQLLEKLRDLQVEHRDLDEVVQRLSKDNSVDQLQLVRLKKRKLVLKDAIAQIESKIIPDILA